MKLTWTGDKELEDMLRRKSETDFKKVVGKNLLEMRNRAVNGGTPVGQYKGGGELRKSAGVDLKSETMGYTKDYAPHVDYGHRQKVGRYVHAIDKRLVQHYVKGQYYLRKNFNTQKPIYLRDLEREISDD